MMRQLRRQKFVVLDAAADVSSFGFEIDESRDIYSPAAGFSRRTVVLLGDTGRICLAVKLIWQDRTGIWWYETLKSSSDAMLWTQQSRNIPCFEVNMDSCTVRTTKTSRRAVEGFGKQVEYTLF